MSSHIDYKYFSRGEGCTEEGCRARKWYIEDGKKFCQRGHEQSGFTQMQQDEDDWNTQGDVARLKRQDKKRVYIALRGKQARDLYLQCYQLILWKQCHWLVNKKGFPKELETVVRDLWGLRLKLLWGENEDSEGYGSGTFGFSSTSEGENTDTDGGTSIASKWSRRSNRKGKEYLPKLIETLALCYLGIMLLRLPISLGDIFKWVTTDEMIYIRAIKEIPKDMRLRLPGQFQHALELRTQLKGSSIYNSVLEMVEFYNIQFEMVFPPLNFPLLIYKHMTDLGLPIEIYPAVRRLATILEVDFTYPILHKKSYSSLAYPEVQLMCFIVIATKLSHPFDDILRHPENESDPTTVKIDWVKWRQIMTDKETNGLRRGEEIKVTDLDVIEMNEEKLDDYLNWYQRMWIDDRNPKMPEKILELFPLHEISPQSNIELSDEQSISRLMKVQGSLIVQNPLADREDDNSKEVNRPGELYRRFRTIEELPENAKAFYEIAAKNIGITLSGLVRAVFQTEVRLENWNTVERKRRLMEDE